MSVFGRKVTVTFGQAGAQGLAISGLRVSFRVEMSQSSVPNAAKLRVWNPNPATIALLESGPLPTVVLSAGYSDPSIPGDLAIPRQIFAGDVVKDGLTVSKEGPDRIVEIEAQDGGNAYQTARINVSFATPVSMSAVVAAVAAQLALPIGLINVLPDPVLPNGGVFSGSAREVLDRIAATVGGAWWISDGVFFFAPTTTPLALPAPLFSSFAGNLIGAPMKKDRGGVQVRALLDASLRPGGTFVLQANTLSGTYVASDVIFEGDSGFATPFYVTTVGRLPGT
jgi:hypothetical protein